MKRTLKIAVLVLAATLMSTNVVVAQTSKNETTSNQTINFSTMSDEEIKLLIQVYPWMAGVIQAAKGQDIDLTTIVVKTTVTRPAMPDSTSTKVLWELRRYTGPRWSFEVGGSADFLLNDTTGTARPKVGGSVSIGFGYVQRKWGVDGFLGLSGIGTDRLFGYYNFTVQPYFTPFRSRDELRRFDVGPIIGLQQSPATAYATFSRENIWGGGGRKTTNARAEVGAFLKYQYRFFKTGSALGLKLSGEVFSASTSFEEYFENVTTGEVLIDEKIKVNDLHAQIKLTLTYEFVTGRRRSNF